jgi:hypothetical protein
MPGTADRNLKRAFFQEELGVLCLSGLCAVAPVPRPHDVGVDVICTLLHPDGNRRLLAGKSFYVQLKAESIKSIAYDREATKWLKNLEMPIFFGRVSIRHGIELYTSHLVSRAMIEQEWESLSISFEPSTKKSKPKPGHRHVVLGRPIMSWGPSDLEPIERERYLHDILSKWVDVEFENLALRPLRMFKPVGQASITFGEWETNQVPVVHPGRRIAMNSKLHSQDTTKYANQASLPTQALGIDCLLKQPHLVPAIVEFSDALVELGVDPADFSMFKLLAAHDWPRIKEE